MRILRLLRLVKLLRVLRGQRLFRRWESRMALNYALLSLYTLAFNLLILTHWMACMWGVVVFT
eukprot:5773824-Pyramimonas_sp.AAC.1